MTSSVQTDFANLRCHCLGPGCAECGWDCTECSGYRAFYSPAPMWIKTCGYSSLYLRIKVLNFILVPNVSIVCDVQAISKYFYFEDLSNFQFTYNRKFVTRILRRFFKMDKFWDGIFISACTGFDFKIKI